MSSVETFGDLNGDIEDLIRLEWFSLKAPIQRLAFKILHGNKVPAFILVYVIYGTDIGMIEGRC